MNTSKVEDWLKQLKTVGDGGRCGDRDGDGRGRGGREGDGREGDADRIRIFAVHESFPKLKDLKYCPSSQEDVESIYNIKFSF